MATHNQYKRFVIGKNEQYYVEGMTEYGQNRVFKGQDTPAKWGMRCFGSSDHATYWNIGFVSNKSCSLSSTKAQYFAWCDKPSQYWFCRTRNWMPYWGEETKRRAQLVAEIRALWAKKWFEEIIPEIKKALISTTPLPRDIVDFVLPKYFAYPYEIKKI